MSINTFLTFDHDDYHRKPIAENIIKLLNSDVDISPMMIDASRGTGKTVFCKRLINLIEKNPTNQYTTIYIDAFSSGYSDEPLFIILNAILKKHSQNGKSIIQKKLNRIYEASLSVLQLRAEPNMKVNLQHQTKEDIRLKNLNNHFNNSLNIEKNYTQFFSRQIESDANFTEFIAAISDLAKECPLVIFIDELDHCRSEFIFKTFETIKHIFNIKNIQFVYIINSQQLTSAIQTLYGEAFNIQGFFDKFIKFSFSLVNNMAAFGTSNFASKNHWKNCIKAFEDDTNIAIFNQINDYQYFILELIENNTLSLREVERFTAYLRIFQTLTSKKITENTQYGVGLYQILIVYLSCFHGDVINNILQNKFDVERIASVLNIAELDVTNNKVTYTSTLLFGLNQIEESYNHFLIRENDKAVYQELMQELFKPRGNSNDNEMIRICEQKISYEIINIIYQTIMVMQLSPINQN